MDSKLKKKPTKPKGLGDSVEKVLNKTGIAKAAKKVLGEDCGCKERKEWLNKQFPYVNLTPKCMTKEQYNAFKDFKKRDPKVLDHKDQEMIHSMYNSVMQVNVQPCVGCSAEVWKGFIHKLELVFDNYKTK